MQASRPRGILAAAGGGDPLEMVAGQAAGQIDAMDRNLARVELGDFVDGSLGKLAVGEQEHGVGLERDGLLHGGPGVGSAVGLDQAQPREQLVLRLEVGRPGPGAARHRDRFVVVEDHLELLRLLQGKDAACGPRSWRG